MTGTHLVHSPGTGCCEVLRMQCVKCVGVLLGQQVAILGTDHREQVTLYKTELPGLTFKLRFVLGPPPADDCYHDND